MMFGINNNKNSNGDINQYITSNVNIGRGAAITIAFFILIAILLALGYIDSSLFVDLLKNNK